MDYFVLYCSYFLGLFSELWPQLKDPPAAAPCWDSGACHSALFSVIIAEPLGMGVSVLWAGLELAITEDSLGLLFLLPLAPKYWDYRNTVMPALCILIKKYESSEND